jgi:hypothetical protein
VSLDLIILKRMPFASYDVKILNEPKEDADFNQIKLNNLIEKTQGLTIRQFMQKRRQFFGFSL